MTGNFRRLRVYILAVTCMVLLSMNHRAMGVSAYPYPFEIIQPDGSKITILLKGDERTKWAQTLDGYSILRNEKGIYEYARLNSSLDMVPSGVQARNEHDRGSPDLQFLSTTKKGIGYSGSQVSLMRSISALRTRSTLKSGQVTGTRKFLCLLIGFTDKAFTKTKADFENLLNQPGYATDGAAGSVSDYYKENSYNQLNMSFTVAGPYVAAHNLSYYGANDSKGYDANPEALVAEAVALADSSVNYADFDNDRDGTVDGVYVIHSGFGEDNGAASNTIWAHSSAIAPVTRDGKIVSDYSMSSEFRGSSGSGITRIGVICHELGHTLGTMDFYDTNYTTNGNYDGTGDWDIMGGGSWNNNGITPAHHNPYSKIVVYGWATTKTFASGENIVLSDAETSNTSFYRINSATADEYFLIENRQKHKFDSYLPGHGMIIYHVDGNFISTAGNEINIGSHQGLYPVCASATGLPPSNYGNINSAGLPFPGTGNKTSFTDATIPNALAWSSAKTNTPLTGISENLTSKTVSFSAPVLPDRPELTTANPATNVLQASFDANWNLSSRATSYRLDVSTNAGFTSFVTGFSDKDVGNVKSFTVSGLSARTVYYYRVRAWNIGGISDYSNIITLRTLSNPPAAPARVTVVSCNDLVTLKWRKSSDPYFLRYRIYGGPVNSPLVRMDSTSAGNADTTRVYSGLIHGRTYNFRVTAVNDDGPESGSGSQVSTVVKTGVIPFISSKWGELLICSNLGDSINSYQWYKGNQLIQGATLQYYQTGKLPGAYSVETVDFEGCVNASNVISATGLKSLTLFPNPASASFTLSMSEPADGDFTIGLFNGAGTKVMEYRVKGIASELLHEIPVGNLPPGLYVVQVMQNQMELYSARLLVIR